ncbi:ammonium transporter [Paenalcaligenes sp. Me131]|uniref:ammonium transporter n=1 Tax=Paenalcaligenes sp. Me131 TaxID=3392636 RepID=UPI003D26D863
MNSTDFAWVSMSTLLVLMMVAPGLALFYGGLVRGKNVLSISTQVLATFGLAIVLWFTYGYSLAFTDGNALIGGWSKLFLSGVFNLPENTFEVAGSIPEISFVAFQATFAGITCALIVGGFAERVRFGAVMLFTAIWMTFSYLPIAHMVWSPGGWLFERGALDFAGGTVVHINAGMAALVAAWYTGRRLGYGRGEALRPHNLTMTMTGAALLWVGWFGFNAGSALGANTLAALAFFNTLIAAAGGILAWLLVERVAKGKASLLGAASGAVAGLVGITPAAGFVGPFGALLIGALTGAVCVWGVNGLRHALNVDDALDVFGIHGVGGIVGALLTGVFNAQLLGGPGLASFSEVPYQLWIQAEGVLITMIWSGVVTLAGCVIVNAAIGWRVTRDEERTGLDISSHGESAYSS